MFNRISIRTLRRVHLYCGCACAPLLTFFIVSGCWQLFMLHRGKKDGSYRPPAVLWTLSSVHTRQVLAVGPDQAAQAAPFRAVVLLMAAGLLLTVSLGVMMAFRVSPHRRPVWTCLAAGVIIPTIITLMERVFR